MSYLKTVGTFVAEILDPEGGWLGASKTGTEFIRVDLRVVDDPECAGQTITWQGWLSDRAFENSIAALSKATGWDGNLATLHAGKSGLVGRHVQIVTEAETYEGKERIKIKWLNAPRRRVEPLADEKAAAMITRMNTRAMAAAHDAKAAIKPKAEPVAENSGHDDEVPF